MYKIKNLCIKLVKEDYSYIKMQGQQNEKKKWKLY